MNFDIFDLLPDIDETSTENSCHFLEGLKDFVSMTNFKELKSSTLRKLCSKTESVVRRYLSLKGLLI